MQPVQTNTQTFSKQKYDMKNLPAKDLQEFDTKEKEVNTLAEGLSVCFLDSRQIHYEVDPLYIEKRQKNFQWQMRASLMEWMMHVSYEFTLKR